MLVMGVKVNGAQRSYPKGLTFTVMADMLLALLLLRSEFNK
jgi:hypothetical protein